MLFLSGEVWHFYYVISWVEAASTINSLLRASWENLPIVGIKLVIRCPVPQPQHWENDTKEMRYINLLVSLYCYLLSSHLSQASLSTHTIQVLSLQTFNERFCFQNIFLWKLVLVLSISEICSGYFSFLCFSFSNYVYKFHISVCRPIDIVSLPLLIRYHTTISHVVVSNILMADNHWKSWIEINS